MSTSRYMVEGIAYELWAQALAGYCIDHPDDERRRDEYEDLIRGASEPPAAVMQPAMELANLYELANGMTLVQILEHIRKNRWGDLDDEWLSDPFEVGYLLAGMAFNHVHNWPSESKLEPIHFEISFDGNTLVWSGDIAPKTNPAPGTHEVLREPWTSSPPTTIVIDHAAFGYMAWLESERGGRLPISFGATQPTNAREALAAAKRFLNRVHGHNNPSSPYERFPCTACGGQGNHVGPGHKYTTQPTPGKGPHEHECTACGGRGPHDGPGHAYTTHVEENPAGGPTRGGEVSRFRTTERGFGRTTAIIPRRREMSDDDAAQRIVDRDPALKRRAEQIAADRSRARQRPRRR